VNLTRGLPASIKTVWSEAKDPDQTYKIYFWPASESRPAPVALTRATHYQVRASKPGTFFLQIVSEDERWQSKAQAVVVALDQEMVQPTASSRFTSGLDLTYPPESAEVHTLGDQAMISFAWTENRRLETDPVSLVVKTADGREVVRKVTKETHLDDLVLPVGDYEWFVETNQKGNREVRLSSAVHALKVQKSRTPLATGVVDAILKSGGSKTVYFADGL
jgi:Xaa-Pro aminopeptidase